MKTYIYPIELNSQGDDKVKISPIGEVKGIDGRVFIIEPNELMKNIQSTKLDIVLNANHGLDKTYQDKAIGWFDFNSIEIRADGIYASLKKTSIGEEVIKSKIFKYLSPEYQVNRNSRKVINIVGVGLVNKPNLLNQEINNKMEGNMKTQEEYELEINSLKDKVKGLTIELAIEKNQLLPKDIEYCNSLELDGVERYIEFHGKYNQETIEHLKKETIVKENNHSHGSHAISTNAQKVIEELGISKEDYVNAM